MSDAFLSAVIDTILPGESRPQAGESPLPCGTQAGLRLDRRADANEHVLGLIAREAGGEAHFVAAAPADRAAILGRVEEQSFEAFRALVSTLLQDYYEAPATLGALGWRASPPSRKAMQCSRPTPRRSSASTTCGRAAPSGGRRSDGAPFSRMAGEGRRIGDRHRAVPARVMRQLAAPREPDFVGDV